MVSKLFYLLMDWETTIIKEPALEQVRSAIRASQTSKVELFSKITSNINLRRILFFQKCPSLMLDWVQKVPRKLGTTQFLKFKRRYANIEVK